MFAVLPPQPIFGNILGDNTLFSSPFRPAKPSPLSSSPLRASSPTHDVRDAASSPVRSSQSMMDDEASIQQIETPFSFSGVSTPTTHQPPLRFAACPARQVPPRLSASRDATRQTRRSLFLRNVRQRADDAAWSRRNCEQEREKLEWWSLERELRAAKEADIGSLLTEHDVEDAADVYGVRGYDEELAAMLALEEEAELEALIESMPMDTDDDMEHLPEVPHVEQQQQQQQQQSQTQLQQQRPASMAFSDDGDYDALFTELLSQSQEDTEMM